MDTHTYFHNRPIRLFILCISIIIFSGQTTIVTAQNSFDCMRITDNMQHGECEALVMLHNANGGTDWRYEYGKIDEGHIWLQTSTPCSWHGVTCDTFGHVTELNLSGSEGNKFGLKGRLSSVIGQLPHLTWLTLTENELTQLPSSIGNLTNLHGLSIWNNQLITLPLTIGQLKNLRWASFSNNRLITLPNEIGNWSDLTWLSLIGNQLTTVPADIGKLSKLVTFYLSDNPLTALPSEITHLENLRTFQIDTTNVLCMAVNVESFSSWSKRDLISCQPENYFYLPIFYYRTNF